MKNEFSKWNLIKYFLLQNRYAWNGLTKTQQDIIYNSNIVHNNIRDDYKNPELYQNGLNYNSTQDRASIYRGKVVIDVLKRYSFDSILEIGPGSGFITRTILRSGVQNYIAVDIVKPFLDYCESSILNDGEVEATCKFIHSDIKDINEDKKYDAIFFLSALHHIPDREDFFNSLIKFCHEDTIIISVEPTHYVQRILRIIKNLPKFLRSEFIHHNNYENLSTHHFLTLNEFKSFSSFEIVEYGFNYSEKLPIKFSRYLSNEIYVLLRLKRE